MKCPKCQSNKTKIVIKKVKWITDKEQKDLELKYSKCLACGNMEVYKGNKKNLDNE